MNKEDIIRMAREAGCIPRRHPEYDNDIQVFATPDVLERFATIIAAAERDACARLCEDAISSIQVGKNVCTNLANAIRARGETQYGREDK